MSNDAIRMPLLCYSCLRQSLKSKHCALCNQREACPSLEHLLRAYYNPWRAKDTGNLLFSFLSILLFFLSAYFSLSLCLCRCAVGLLDWWEGRPTTLGFDWPISITITQPSEIAALSKWSPISYQNDTWPWPDCSNECEKRDMKGKSKARGEESFFMMKYKSVIAFNPLLWYSVWTLFCWQYVLEIPTEKFWPYWDFFWKNWSLSLLVVEVFVTYVLKKALKHSVSIWNARSNITVYTIAAWLE